MAMTTSQYYKYRDIIKYAVDHGTKEGLEEIYKHIIAEIVKERIEDGANEKAALRFPITALSFASISIFPG